MYEHEHYCVIFLATLGHCFCWNMLLVSRMVYPLVIERHYIDQLHFLFWAVISGIYIIANMSKQSFSKC